MEVSPAYIAVTIAAFAILLITSHLKGTGAMSAAISSYSVLALVCVGILAALMGVDNPAQTPPRLVFAILLLVSCLLGFTIAYFAMSFDALAEGAVSPSVLLLSRLSIFFFMAEIAVVLHSLSASSSASNASSPKQTTAQIVVFLLTLVQCIVVATMAAALRNFTASG